jgi:hypothetical protein
MEILFLRIQVAASTIESKNTSAKCVSRAAMPACRHASGEPHPGLSRAGCRPCDLRRARGPRPPTRARPATSDARAARARRPDPPVQWRSARSHTPLRGARAVDVSSDRARADRPPRGARAAARDGGRARGAVERQHAPREPPAAAPTSMCRVRERSFTQLLTQWQQQGSSRTVAHDILEALSASPRAKTCRDALSVLRSTHDSESATR